MRVRALDATHDWTFGKGQNNYKRNQKAVSQNIQTRLASFLGDCFFDLNAGIDWFGFLGSKDTVGFNLAVSAVILNTRYLTSLTQLELNVTAQRLITIKYAVKTNFSISEQITGFQNFILTEDGEILVTESGIGIIA